jgi:hypothetical protein
MSLAYCLVLLNLLLPHAMPLSGTSRTGYRDVVDTTEAVTAVHINHDYVNADGSVAKFSSNVKNGVTFWQNKNAKHSNWQILHNNNLAVRYGT